MRHFTTASILSLVLATTMGLAGCASPEDESDVDDQTSNVTGGTGAIESPVVYLFADSARDTVKCAGAMLGDRIAVTAKACAVEGMVVGRAIDRNGKGRSAKVKLVRVPNDADADIALIELDRSLPGTHAVITHTPLRAGYSVNGVAATDGRGILTPSEGEASSVTASMNEETSTHSVIVPESGSEICDGDLGAPVCSSTEAKIAGIKVAGTCGLSGLVVGKAGDATAPAAAPSPTQPGALGCSDKGWKVAQLGRYADFLKQAAPKAFEPMRIDRDILRNVAFVPDGLWGYKTRGDVKTCKIETATLAPVALNTASATITAKVAFGSMDRFAVAFGRFGIAPKADPTKMRWLPAKALGATRGSQFETSFEGVVNADKDGEYIVAFRASANGGESWVECDSDGIENGYQAEKALPIVIGTAAAPPAPTPPAPGEATPQDTPYQDPAPSEDTSAGDDYSEDGTTGDATEDEPSTTKKKKAASGGCSVGTGPQAPVSTGFGAAGALLGLALIARRRRSV